MKRGGYAVTQGAGSRKKALAFFRTYEQAFLDKTKRELFDLEQSYCGCGRIQSYGIERVQR